MGLNKSTFLGHLACFGAYCIFGFNIVCCKNISNAHVMTPMDLLCFRAAGATMLFWLVSLFMPKEKVPMKDMLQIFVASMLGLFLTQYSFLKAITLATSIDVSIANTCTPVLTMLVAAIFLKEPITWKKAGGVALSFAGVLWLIFQSTHAAGPVQTRPMGILLTITNALCFALYLGICRPVIQRYSVVTLMKWMFLFALIVSLPFSAGQIVALDYAAVPAKVWWEVGYLIIFATFVAYFLIPLGQQRIRPTLVSMYGYLQPIIASAVGIAVGMDRLTWMKLLAALAVFAGVAIVNRSRARSQ